VTGELPGTVVVTRPRHPLAGRELRVLGGMRRHGRLELLLASVSDDHGLLGSARLPAG